MDYLCLKMGYLFINILVAIIIESAALSGKDKKETWSNFFWTLKDTKPWLFMWWEGRQSPVQNEFRSYKQEFYSKKNWVHISVLPLTSCFCCSYLTQPVFSSAQSHKPPSWLKGGAVGYCVCLFIVASPALTTAYVTQ